MRRAFNLAWLLLIVGMALGYAWLPEQVGSPSKQASRAFFAGVMAFVACHALLCSHHFVLWLGRRAPGVLNLPHKAYWLAPERRQDSLQRMATQLSVLGLMLVALTAAIYAWPILEAQLGPLPDWAAWTGAALLAIGFAVWMRWQYRLFPAPPPAVHEPALRRRPGRPPSPDRQRR